MPIPTVQEILKQSGFSDDDIAKFDAKAINGRSEERR